MLIVALFMPLFFMVMIVIHLVLKIDVVINPVTVDRDVGEPIVGSIAQAEVDVVRPFAIKVGITELVSCDRKVFTVHEELHC